MSKFQAQGGKFQYQKPNQETIQKRQNNSGGAGESFLSQKFPTFIIKEGDYQIRLLPATWDNAEHYGLEIFVNYGIGPDNSSFLSISKMKGGNERDPVKEERERAIREGDRDYADTLKPNQRFLYWLIDRDKEKEGPLLWAAPYTLDKDLALLSQDKRTKELLYVDHPEQGYDVFFSRNGKPPQVRYTGLSLDRRPSPLHDDPKVAEKWLQFVMDNPLPSVLIHRDYDYIKNVFGGGGGSVAPAPKDDRPQTRADRTRRPAPAEEEPELGTRRKHPPAEEDDDFPARRGLPTDLDDDDLSV